jgi:hypothetical protein
MKITLAIIGLLLSAYAFAGSKQEKDPVNEVIDIIKKQAPILKIGEYIQDEKGCLYEVKKTQDGTGIMLFPTITTLDGKIVCKIK